MTSLAICPTTNAEGKHDVSGAFYPEARAFSRLHSGDLYRFEIGRPTESAAQKSRRP